MYPRIQESTAISTLHILGMWREDVTWYWDIYRNSTPSDASGCPIRPRITGRLGEMDIHSTFINFWESDKAKEKVVLRQDAYLHCLLFQELTLLLAIAGRTEAALDLLHAYNIFLKQEETKQ